MKTLLVLGANSGIAKETCRVLSKDGIKFFLVGRDASKLSILKEDLSVRGASGAEVLQADLNDIGSFPKIWESAKGFLGEVDGVLIAHGVLGDQKICESSWSEAEGIIKTNFLSPVAFLTIVSDYFEKRRSGVIAVIGSVAGDRGRKSNYVYGSAKGGLEVFLSGLRNRLDRSGVRVLTIKPGFVDTPMTAHIKKGPLFASASTVGASIAYLMKSGSGIHYVPWFWRFIMLIIRSIPERIFKRLSL